MAENLIFEQSLEEFGPVTEFPGLYGQFVESPLFELVIGDTYRVIWDGEEFLVEARDASQILDGWLYLGNGTPYGIPGNNEPFVIGVSSYGVQFLAYDKESTHNITIYHIVEDSGKIIILDRQGIPNEYEGIESITFDTADGGTQMFTKGRAIEGIEIELDFSDDRDQPIYAPDGTLVKSAIIKKPVDLVPENIAQGVTIAGIEGIHKGESGGSFEDALFIANYCSGNAGDLGKNTLTISHTINVPVSATLMSVRGAKQSETVFSNAYFTQQTISELNDIISYTRNADKITIAYTFSISASVDHYVALSEVVYKCPGITIRTEGTAKILYADGDAEDCGPIVQLPLSVDIVDFSNSKMTNIADNTCYRGYTILSVLLPPTLTSIGSSAFQNCTSLTNITIPDSVVNIGNYAFSGCGSLTSITIPDGVTSIGDFTFNGCTSLTSVTIGNGVTSIGSNAFRHCTGLTSVTIPDSVTSIDNYAFNGCDNLALVDLSQCTHVPRLGTNNFNIHPEGFEVRVTSSMYDSFAAATNWSALVDYMVVV